MQQDISQAQQHNSNRQSDYLDHATTSIPHEVYLLLTVTGRQITQHPAAHVLRPECRRSARPMWTKEYLTALERPQNRTFLQISRCGWQQALKIRAALTTLGTSQGQQKPKEKVKSQVKVLQQCP